MSHAEYTGVPRDTPMEKALFACDELAGFITACALVKPGKSLAEVEAKSVRKKMKDKAFARNVKREDIVNGAADLGVDLEEHIAFCIEALKGIADQLGLDGRAAQASCRRGGGSRSRVELGSYAADTRSPPSSLAIILSDLVPRNLLLLSWMTTCWQAHSAIPNPTSETPPAPSCLPCRATDSTPPYIARTCAPFAA